MQRKISLVNISFLARQIFTLWNAMNIEQLLEAAKIIEQRDEGKLCSFSAKISRHMSFSRPANVLFPPQTIAKKRSQASVKRDKKQTKRSPSYR